jgi:succinate dehydrogenase / fumarate reductase membrane anchor subunit
MENSKSRWLWLVQAVSGVALVLLLGLHWIVQHYLASEGLRSFVDVETYLKQPLALVLEISFLIIVSGHALLGVRAILLDLGLKPKLQRSLDISLWFVGIITVLYGVQLVFQIIQQ